MIELKRDQEEVIAQRPAVPPIPLAIHPTFYPVYEKIQKWLERFSHSVDNGIFSDLFLLYLLATKKYLDHRSPTHLFRLVLSIHFIQKKLLKAATLHPHMRHLEIRWIPTALSFPFSTKPVLGCLVGFNVMDRYELFDEENILLALQKYLPELRLVKESPYCHTSQYKNFKIFYLEIEKKDNTFFSLSEQNLLKNNLEEKIRKSIQSLSPTIFMGLNDEEIYKNILVLSQEIQSLDDIPQAYITFDQQTGKEIIFRITLVHISPFHRFSLKEQFVDAHFVPQRNLVVRHLGDHPIEAHLFRLHLPRSASLVRSDGSLDFYIARKRVVALLEAAIGEFRDYNGGILIKQQELLHSFKDNFPEHAHRDSEFLESFFYNLNPLEKQIVLESKTLSNLFAYFLDNRKQKLSEGSYSINVYPNKEETYLIVHGNHSSLAETISIFLQEHSLKALDIAYNLINTIEGVFFNCVFLQSEAKEAELFIQSLRHSLDQWHKKMKNLQVLKIGLEYSIVSLDPRIGGESISANIIRLLFEGLTRFNKNGNIENAVAESIEISPDKKRYVFRLRPTLWNDASPLSAYDFEYAWKKILSPDFKTSFAYLFHPIKNAKEAKEGKIPQDQIGIRAVDNRTLIVDLICPTSYFLQLTAHPLYSPINRLIDQQHPEWPYQSEKNYPCNGPFQLKINQPNQGYQLIKNPYYWDANQIVLDQITLTQTNPAQAVEALRKKELDWIGNPFGNWNSFYKAEKSTRVISVPNLWLCWIVLNTNCFPFNNLKLRQAFSYAIDRTQLVNHTFSSLNPANPAYSITHPSFRENCKLQLPDIDIEKARWFLHEALQELGISKEELSPLKFFFVEKGARDQVSICLQKQIKENLGLELHLKPLPWGTLFNKMTKGECQIGLMQWVSYVNDPIYTLNAFRADQGINFSKWDNAEFQRWLSLTEQEVNPFQHSSHLLKAEEILCQQIPVIPLFYNTSQALVSKDLHVPNPALSGFYNISGTYFNKKEN